MVLKNRFKNLCVIISCLSIFICNNYLVYAGTVDDIRELVGRERISQQFSEEEIAKITKNYMLIERNNLYSQIDSIGDSIDVNSEVEVIRTELASRIESKQEEFVNSFMSCKSIDDILELKTELNNLVAEKNKLKDTGPDIKIEFEENKWTEEYMKVQNMIKGVEEDYEIGDVGKSLKSPLGGKFIITSPFGVRIDLFDSTKLDVHRGLDLGANLGDPVGALWNGIVSAVYTSDSGGNVVEIMHGKDLRTIYMHLNEFKVKVGDNVKQYETIGLAGSTGNSTGPHLHLEVYLDDILLNPILLFGTKGVNQLKQWISIHPDELDKARDIVGEVKDEVKDVNRHKAITRGFYEVREPDYSRDGGSIDGGEEDKESDIIDTNLNDSYKEPKPGILITIDEYFEQ